MKPILIVIFSLLCCFRAQGDEDLAAYWPLDEGEGSVARDQSGNGHDGQIRGEIKWVEGREGKALSFDGRSTFIDCGNPPSLDIEDEITIECWVKLNSHRGGGIVNKYFPSSGYYLTASWRDNSLPYFFVRQNKNASVVFGKMMEVGQWHHLMGMAKKDGLLRLYLDGNLKQETELGHGFGNKTSNLLIGVYQSDYFDGVMDEIKIHKRTVLDNKIIGESFRKHLRPFNELMERANFEKKLAKLGAGKDINALRFSHLFAPKLSALKEKSAQLAANFPNLIESEWQDQFQTLELSLLQFDKILRAFEAREINIRDFLCTVVQPVSERKILPMDTFVPGSLDNKMAITACPGEYQPGSFVISAFSELSSLSLESDGLQSSTAKISAANVRIRVVKCWYQAGTAWFDIQQRKTRKILVPELLLNDDSLVRVDTEKQENYLKIIRAGKEEYVWISNPDEQNKRGHPTIAELPVRDSPALLPLAIPAGQNKQFWVTIKVPDDTPAGTYQGSIKLKNHDTEIHEIKIILEVLPFQLAPPVFTSSIYYGAKLDKTGVGAITEDLKNEKQLKAEFENLFAHGVSNIVCYQNFDEELLDQYLAIKAASGMNNTPLYYLEMGVYNYFRNCPKDQLPLLAKRVQTIVEFAQKRRIPEVYFYALDEAKEANLKKQREAWDVVHQAGGKIFVAGGRGQNFKLMGDIQDLLICAGPLSKDEAAQWHSKGHQIWSYANPQAGVENPEIYRRNYGLLLWQNGYDGACTFAYQTSMGNIWNDFDHKNYRDHNFTYPTVDGVIDTIAWEGYREGIDDVRYLSTLLKAIEENKNSANAGKKQQALEAQKYLKSFDAEKGDSDSIRREIIRHILELRKLG
ncbi:MAG: hypothetical protein PHV34_03200 [Verrucomicrobiae bacterium]|nr:hypothetical protein [Verrucomicrobiae bacterium]